MALIKIKHLFAFFLTFFFLLEPLLATDEDNQPKTHTTPKKQEKDQLIDKKSKPPCHWGLCNWVDNIRKYVRTVACCEKNEFINCCNACGFITDLGCFFCNACCTHEDRVKFNYGCGLRDYVDIHSCEAVFCCPFYTVGHLLYLPFACRCNCCGDFCSSCDCYCVLCKDCYERLSDKTQPDKF